MYVVERKTSMSGQMMGDYGAEIEALRTAGALG